MIVMHCYYTAAHPNIQTCEAVGYVTWLLIVMPIMLLLLWAVACANLGSSK